MKREDIGLLIAILCIVVLLVTGVKSSIKRNHNQAVRYIALKIVNNEGLDAIQLGFYIEHKAQVELLVGSFQKSLYDQPPIAKEL
jgi:hypothetical protein